MVDGLTRSTTPTRTRPSGSPWPGSWRTPATSAWSRSPSTSARRMQYQLLPGVRHRRPDRAAAAGRQPRPAAAAVEVVGATSGTRWPSARAWRSPRCRWPASTRPSRTAGSGCRRPSWPGTTAADGRFVPARRARAATGCSQPTTAAELIAILQQVPMLDATLAVEPWGEIPGYSVAAKTGTAQVSDAKAHCLCLYGSSYIGMAPASNPQLVVAVNVQNPEARELLRQRRGRAGVLSRHEVRAADAEDSAGSGPSVPTSGSPHRDQR